MADPPDSRFLVAAARADFLEGVSDLHRAGVADHVVASWRRSVSSGVQPSVVESPYFTELNFESRLVRCAEPVIDQLAEQLADIPMCVALTDGKARLLARRDSSSSFGRATDRVHFAQGFGYAEGMVGTNGVGTVLESGHSMHIVGAEHFVDSLQAFACAGAPVHDPFSGRIEGVLDISCFADHSTPVLHSLVRAAATRIEHNLVADRNESKHALFDLYSRVDARSRDAVLAIGPELTVANTRMQTLLAGGDQESLQDHVRFLMYRNTTVDDRIDLPSGTRVRFRASTVAIGDDLAGMVGVVTLLNEVESSPVVETRGQPPLPAATTSLSVQRPCFAESSSTAWGAAAATVGTALEGRDRVMVLGEPGSGRLTLLREAHTRRCSSGRVVAVPSDEIERDPHRVVERVLATGERDDLFVLQNIDRLSSVATATLTDHFLVHDDRTSLIAATSGELAGSSRHIDAGLLSLFTASATVPPLRHRGTDVASLVTALLAELAPHRDVRLSRDAQRIVAGFPWPGNIRQLREALAAAIDARPVGTIEVTDLPAYCQSTPRSALRPVDQVERDAIVSALRQACGNRKAAAAELGFARSTLYRKISQYGITGSSSLSVED